jgi:hypothetical protein
MDRLANVDKRAGRPLPDLLQRVLDEAQQRFGIRTQILSLEPGAGRRPDARVRLGLGKWRRDYDVELKTGLRAATLGLVIQRMAPREDRALLIADHVTPPMAETLRHRGIQFLDAAGNAYLRDATVHVWVKGERPTGPNVRLRERGRAFTQRGSQVVLALLCRPAIVNENYRHIAILAGGVAHGTVGWVMQELQALGFVATVGGRRKLLNTEPLLDRWAEAYLRVLRHKRMLGRFRTDDLERMTDIPVSKYGVVFGGEPAAALLTKHLQPGAITLYTDRIDPRLLVDYRLRRDDHGNVEILRKFWGVDATRVATAPRPVVYADLIGTGDARCLEAAKLVREQFLARPE